MTPITLTIYGRPQQRGSKKPFLIRTRSGAYAQRKSGTPVIAMTDDNPKSKDWMTSVRSVAATEMNGRNLLTGPILLDVEFYFARPRNHFRTGKHAGLLKPGAPKWHTQSPDLDKLLRCLCDSLSGIVFQDDRQVFHIVANRMWTTIQERAEVTITEVRE